MTWINSLDLSLQNEGVQSGDMNHMVPFHGAGTCFPWLLCPCTAHWSFEGGYMGKGWGRIQNQGNPFPVRPHQILSFERVQRGSKQGACVCGSSCLLMDSILGLWELCGTCQGLARSRIYRWNFHCKVATWNPDLVFGGQEAELSMGFSPTCCTHGSSSSSVLQTWSLLSHIFQLNRDKKNPDKRDFNGVSWKESNMLKVLTHWL